MDNIQGYELWDGGSIPSGGAKYRMLTANLYTQLLIENVKMHPALF